MIKTALYRVYGGNTNEAMGLYNSAEIDREIYDKYLSQGWELFNTHLGGFSDGGVTIIYILIREKTKPSND